ncbi:MAG: histidine phosphatase family protein, partial [Thermoguttaceae bacterium]|nr:histidine phosphatase family protein [Thermoguttaceae bacterium]
MLKKTLIVARHGNTFNKGDVILRVGARTDLPLTATGVEQAKKIGAILAARGLVPTEIYAAPLLRTL